MCFVPLAHSRDMVGFRKSSHILLLSYTTSQGFIPSYPNELISAINVTVRKYIHVSGPIFNYGKSDPVSEIATCLQIGLTTPL